MAKVYERAKDDVEAIMREVLEEYHPELAKAGVTVDLLMVGSYDSDGLCNYASLKHRGYPAAAVTKINPLKARALGQADAEITIDEFTWGELSPSEQRALMDHELTHLQVAGEAAFIVAFDPKTGELNDAVKTDDLKRPKLRMRKHDWQIGGFKEVARRWRDDALEVQAIAKCKDDHGQLYWDFTDADAPSTKKTKATKKAAAAAA